MSGHVSTFTPPDDSEELPFLIIHFPEDSGYDPVVVPKHESEWVIARLTERLGFGPERTKDSRFDFLYTGSPCARNEIAHQIAVCFENNQLHGHLRYVFKPEHFSELLTTLKEAERGNGYTVIWMANVGHMFPNIILDILIEDLEEFMMVYLNYETEAKTELAEQVLAESISNSAGEA